MAEAEEIELQLQKTPAALASPRLILLVVVGEELRPLPEVDQEVGAQEDPRSAVEVQGVMRARGPRGVDRHEAAGKGVPFAERDVGLLLKPPGFGGSVHP